ncbi:MAG: serine hydrolase [Candidatus Rokubacteria bacterium]|nr:serine hydrolase [Candidatus Rokubacteria bacterium]
MTRARGFARASVALVSLVLTASASAQDVPLRSVDAMEQTFARWVKQHKVRRATLAIARGDRLVLAKGYGGLTGGSRVLLASLSKAVTATCTTTLIEQGTLRFDTPLAEFVDRWATRYRKPADARLGTVTIAQLLTHRAGFSRVSGDPVTGSNLVDQLGRRAVTQVTMYDLVPGMLRHTLTDEPGSTYTYTNAPHLLLALVIEAVTGQSYETYCAEAVLRPHGIAGAKFHAKWAVLGAFGGWNLSGPEYLAFYRAFLPTGTFLNADTRRWLVEGTGKELSVGGPVFYSLLFVRPVAGGHNFFHMGTWGYRQSPSGPSGGINDSMGTMAASLASGASWFAYFEPRPSDEARDALDHAFASFATIQR